MRYKFLLVLLWACYTPTFAQSDDIWTAFYNKDNTLVGFRDPKQTVRIQPKFGGFTSAKKFDRIMAASEEVHGKWIGYYLIKSGKKIGQDSLHVFDNGADCEKEGFIRFRDRKTDQVGLFNSQGIIAVPAKYNELTRVNNGLIIALQGAKKKVFEGGEHYSWEGGRQLLIDTNNKVLVADFNPKASLNFFSLKVEAKVTKDPIRKSFQTIDQKQYYSFVDYDKEFRAWLGKELLDQLSKETLMQVSHKDITSWNESDGWIKENQKTFLDQNFEILKARFEELKDPKTKYEIFDEGLNPFIYASSDFDSYFNNCGEAKEAQFPVKNVVISHTVNNDLKQDHLTFLRTENGYKLINVSFKD